MPDSTKSETKAGECPACGARFVKRRASSRFCSRPCMWSQNGGHNKKPETWWVCPKGYIVGRVWEGGRQRHVKKHRLLMERRLGRRLHPTEDVHHVNGDKQDNRLENLQVIDHGEHSRLTNAARDYARGYKLSLSSAERQRRSRWMASLHAAKAEGR